MCQRVFFLHHLLSYLTGSPFEIGNRADENVVKSLNTQS